MKRLGLIIALGLICLPMVGVAQHLNPVNIEVNALKGFCLGGTPVSDRLNVVVSDQVGAGISNVAISITDVTSPTAQTRSGWTNANGYAQFPSNYTGIHLPYYQRLVVMRVVATPPHTQPITTGVAYLPGLRSNAVLNRYSHYFENGTHTLDRSYAEGLTVTKIGTGPALVSMVNFVENPFQAACGFTISPPLPGQRLPINYAGIVQAESAFVALHIDRTVDIEQLVITIPYLDNPAESSNYLLYSPTTTERWQGASLYQRNLATDNLQLTITNQTKPSLADLQQGLFFVIGRLPIAMPLVRR